MLAAVPAARTGWLRGFVTRIRTWQLFPNVGKEENWESNPIVNPIVLSNISTQMSMQAPIPAQPLTT
jgi:hypothetical protein